MIGKLSKKAVSLLFVICISVFALSAQHTPGSWKLFPMSGETYQQIIDTPNKVYYITGNSLHCYDKEYGESSYLAPGINISDSGIASMYYNANNKYLMIVYSNGNIDLVYDDGRIVNMPEIKDANLAVSKTVNHAMFYKNRIYVATTFGIVVFDDQKHNVVESGVFNVNVKKILATDEYLVILANDKFCMSPINDRHNSMDKFTEMADAGANIIQHLGGNKYLSIPGSGSGATLFIIEFLFDTKAINYTTVTTLPNVSQLLPYKEGFYAVCDNGIVLLDKNGALVKTQALSTDVKSQKLGMWKGLDSVWAVDGDGLANYDLSGETTTVLSEKFKPESSLMFGAGTCTYSSDGAVYTTIAGISSYHPYSSSLGDFDIPFICERYDWKTGTFTAMHPYGYQINYSAECRHYANLHKSKYFYGSAGRTAVDPIDPTIVYHTNFFEGLIVVKGGQLYAHFDKSNSPLYLSWGTRPFDVKFDPAGNLWVGQWRETGASNTEDADLAATQTIYSYKILPKAALEKLRKDPTTVTYKDWKDTTFPLAESGRHDMNLLFSTKSSAALYVRGGWDGPIIGLDTKGTYDVTSDDTYNVFNGFLDQDGAVNTPTFKPCTVEDKNGHIWIGTTSGIFIVKDLKQLGNSNLDNLQVIRPKVARNDGTNYADYLLSSETVLCIAVDPSNRKWIATQSSGIYLVNEDGTEIISQFTKDNSSLISNMVFTVACDPDGNDVLIGTPEGMFLYSSTSAPAADDYSEVYAYPNPVRPEYTGWITINGLMDNSLVKITDISGNVLWQGNSEGGMAVWDGCNASGERVRSGVYLVFASKSENETSTGAVTKIVVIN